MAENRVIRMSEVEQHNTGKSVWIVVHDKVYDVTKFLDEVSVTYRTPITNCCILAFAGSLLYLMNFTTLLITP